LPHNITCTVSAFHLVFSGDAFIQILIARASLRIVSGHEICLSGELV